MSDDAQAPDAPAGPQRELLIKKIKPPAPPPHGGAWKVAYADFVTAMMAFFLLLWLLNASTDEQLDGITNFFEPIGELSGSSGGEGVFGGISASDPGPVPKPGLSTQLSTALERTPGDKVIDEKVVVEELINDKPNVTDSESENEANQFKAAEAAIQQALDEVPELRNLHEAIKIDITQEGLRIQLIDQQNTAMFKPGGAELEDHTKTILLLVANVVERLPNKISVSGHTDSEPFRSRTGRTNWELSLDRANAGRRELEKNHIPTGRFKKVIGLADRDPLAPETPLSPRNRRLILVLLRTSAQRKDDLPTPPRIFKTD